MQTLRKLPITQAEQADDEELEDRHRTLIVRGSGPRGEMQVRALFLPARRSN